MELQSNTTLAEPLLAQDQTIGNNPSKPNRPKPNESYHGKASPLSTGMLFGPTPRGIVNSIPHPHKPCLLFSDWCPVGQCAHITLLEKEYENSAPSAEAAKHAGEDLNLFTVVHVCEALAKHEDGGSRLLKKLTGSKGSMKVARTPVLVHEGDILVESDNVQSMGGSGLSGLLLPGYIDGAVGKAHSLRPADAVGLYNMNLFIQRHSNLPYLVNELITSQSSTHRIRISTDLLNLLKTVDSNLKKFEGPYLCGEQFTLADICLFPFLERIVLVLSQYRNFFIPPSLTHLISWYDTVSIRPSVRTTTENRNEISMNTYCYEHVGRKQYLIEVYEPLVVGEVDLFRELNDERGQAGVNVYREVKEEDDRDRRVCEVKTCHKMQQCVAS